MSSDPNNKAGDGAVKDANTTIDLTKYVPKDDFEKVSNSVKDLESKLDEAKLSLLDPEYISFLESKKGGRVQNKVNNVLDFDNKDLSKLTSKELLQTAVDEATKAIRSELEDKYEKRITGVQTTLSDILAVFELQECEKKHPDFNDFREDTKGILESSTTPLTIEQAFKIAKQNASDKNADKPDSKKADSHKTSSEKPGGTVLSDSMVTKTFKNKQDAAEDAWDQVVGAGKDTL